VSSVLTLDSRTFYSESAVNIRQGLEMFLRKIMVGNGYRRTEKL
jgi:hypothetical protein